MNILLIVTAVALIISFAVDKNKSIQGLKIAFKRFLKIAEPFLFVIILVSFGLYFFDNELISKYLVDKNILYAAGAASILGSIALMPGFIAFPLSGILRDNGVPFTVISAFTTTLMMVGILTFPVEKKFFGTKVAVLRNVISFIIAIIVAIITGIVFGEIL